MFNKESDSGEMKEETENKHKNKKDVHKNAKILVVGCGNSRVSEELYDDGYQTIMSIDSSNTVIKQMKDKYKDRNPNFIFTQMDVRGMDFRDRQFDFVLDKGLFETILCGEMSAKNIQKSVSEIHRCLKPGGVYCMISAGSPELRLHYLKKPIYDWVISIE